MSKAEGVIVRLLKYLLTILAITVFWTESVYALPVFEEVRGRFIKSDSLLLDRHGNLLHELRTDKQKRRLDWTPLAGISPSLVAAVLASEDARFFEHGGVDYRALGAAAWSYVTSGSKRGASTVSMQLASLLNTQLQNKKDRRTVFQKFRQIDEARSLEKSWTKNQILEAYLNLVSFRGEYQGIAAAARGFFGRDPHGLDQTQSLILAALIRAPNAGADALNRRAMLLNGQLAWQVPADHLADTIHKLYSGAGNVRPRAVWAPQVARQLFTGRQVSAIQSCTLDSTIQKFTLDHLAQQISALAAQHVSEGAVVVFDNHTGNTLAYASYSNRVASPSYVDGVRARRQAGSTLKPFLYAAAIDAKLITAASILDDSPLDVAVVSGIYQPDNYDSSFRGPVPARIALASSLNVPAVRVLAMTGTEPFLTRLRQAGLTGLTESGDYYGLSLALGSADVTLWELTNAYRMLANAGRWSEPHLSMGRTQNVRRGKQVFSAQASYIIADILSDRTARSVTFGLENPLATRFWTAVKTGTSKDMRDNWCIGFSRRYTVGVWVGNFSGEPMWNVSGITGAAPIWMTVMNYLHRNLPSTPPKPPRGVRREICWRESSDERSEWFLAGTEPARTKAPGSFVHDRIVYPPSGAILALDPDIPAASQKVFFTAHANNGEYLVWALNDMPLGASGKTVAWTPKTGKYVLSILNGQNKMVDTVHFEVRGQVNE